VKVVAPDGRLVDMNPAGLAMIDADSIEQVRGCALDELVAPEHRAAFGALHQRVLAGEPGALEFEAVGLRGERRWLHTHAVPLRENGRVAALLGITRDVTARRAAEAELNQVRRRLELILDAAADGIHEIDRDGTIVFENAAAARLLGYAPGELIGRPVRETVLRDADAECPIYATLRDGRPRQSGDEAFRRRDGTRFPVDYVVTAMRDAAGGTAGAVVVFRDVSVRREQEQKIARLSRIRAVLLAVRTAILRLDDRDRILQEACRVAVADGGFAIAFACVHDPATGIGAVVAHSGRSAALVDRFVVTTAADSPYAGRPANRALREKRVALSNDVAADASLAAVHDELRRQGVGAIAACPVLVDDRAVAVVLLFASAVGFFDAEEVELLEVLSADLSFALDRLSKAQRLDYLACYDALTGLPNSRLFHDRLGRFLAAGGPHPIAVMVVDLERFTQINDVLGRQAGDALLQQVGARLAAELEQPYCLAHVGADTFAVARVCDEERGPAELGNRLVALFARPFALAGRELQVSAQAGIAVYPADGTDPETLFKNAEAALKQAKAAGDRVHYYARALNERIAERLALEAELRAAIDADQFVLHYQPRIDLISGELIGAEALVRWRHPREGLLPPARFIALAEETGLIVRIGDWVIRAACAQQAAWIAARLDVVPVAVNLSSLQFKHGDLLQTVREALARHGLEARLLELELTETAVMQDAEAAARTLHQLRRLGVGLALDDFGTGYSSLAHLKRFPFNAVKIDQSFVTDVTSNADDAAIANAIIAMAHRLGLRVVAEGVETAGQLAYLRAQGCDEMQGDYYGAAVGAADFAAQLRGARRLALPPTLPVEQHTVLVVDDDAGVRSAINRVLRRDGYRVLLAASGPEALELLAVHPVQVIIADQRMTPMSGTEFLSVASQLYPETLRIILSGYTDLDVVTEAVNRGAVFKLLTKPWEDELLREHVRDAVRRHRPRATA
jgi:PAS domain S-box-containing protein/diguanylate cyclase (GGDEF)-like protein